MSSSAAVLVVAVPAFIGAVGSVLSAYIAVKVRSTAAAVNGQVHELALELRAARAERSSSSESSESRPVYADELERLELEREARRAHRADEL